jgi:hypothetical protein
MPPPAAPARHPATARRAAQRFAGRPHEVSSIPFRFLDQQARIGAGAGQRGAQPPRRHEAPPLFA